MAGSRRYRYLGPDELRSATTASAPVRTVADLESWLSVCDQVDLAEPFTFVVDIAGVLRLAPRRSEHVVCAQGRDVLAAGEMSFARSPAGWSVRAVSNQSTGFCPDPGSWAAVSTALDRAGITPPGGYTDVFVFRRCAGCGERNVVRDDDFTCAVCGRALPAAWNF